MKRSMAAALIALTALLCACAAQPQWETVGDGCTQAATGEPGVIYVHLPADAVEEVFSERGAQHVYTQPDGGYEITAQTMPAAPSGAIVRQLSGFDEQALHVYERAAGPSGSSRGMPVPTRAEDFTGRRSSRTAHTAMP